MLIIVLIILAFLFFIGKIMHNNAAINKKEGNEEKTAAQNALIGGVGCLTIPAVVMIGIMLIWGIVWVFCTFSEMIHIGSPILIFLGVICPVVGAVFMLYGIFKG